MCSDGIYICGLSILPKQYLFPNVRKLLSRRNDETSLGTKLVPGEITSPPFFTALEKGIWKSMSRRKRHLYGVDNVSYTTFDIMRAIDTGVTYIIDISDRSYGEPLYLRMVNYTKGKLMDARPGIYVVFPK